MNFVNCTPVEKGSDIYLEFGSNSIKLTEGVATKVKEAGVVGKEVVMGIRPEDLHDEEAFLTSYPDAVIDALVELTEMMGAETYLYLKIMDNQFTARVNPRTQAKPGEKLEIAFDTNRLHLFDKETELAILN